VLTFVSDTRFSGIHLSNFADRLRLANGDRQICKKPEVKAKNKANTKLFQVNGAPLSGQGCLKFLVAEGSFSLKVNTVQSFASG
jgi:hypothetical protein